MATLRPDPIFYPSPRQAMKAPPEELAYVVVLNPDGNGRPDALAVIDVDPGSTTYQQVVGRVELGMGDEGSSPLRLERLLGGPLPLRAPLARRAPIPVVPGLKSSHIYVSALGAPDGNGPGGVFIVDQDSFDTVGRWEMQHGQQQFAYDVWWHLGYDSMVTS